MFGLGVLCEGLVGCSVCVVVGCVFLGVVVFVFRVFFWLFVLVC